MSARLRLLVPALGVALAAACSAARSGSDASPSTGGDAGSGGDALDAARDVLTETIGLETGLSDTGSPCDADPASDHDGDGWLQADGDCNDCDPNVNPGAYDVAGNAVDEDCSGVADDEPVECDWTLALDADAKDAARAMGLCRFTTDGAAGKARTWGVVDAQYVKADGTWGMNPLSHGVLDGFGPYVNPQEGGSMLMLSSGTARRPGDLGYDDPSDADMNGSSSTPPGFPKDAAFCPDVVTSSTPIANDPAGLELTLRVPTNARSFSYDFDFYSYEFPSYVCSTFNDSYVALLWSKSPPPNAKDGNISFDAQGNPISVNNALLDVCQPQSAGGRPFPCLLGNAGLLGTGYGALPGGLDKGHAATGWLQTTAPVQPGETIKLRLVVWDAGDHALASSVLVDHFAWKAEPASGSSTGHVQNPK